MVRLLTVIPGTTDVGCLLLQKPQPTITCIQTTITHIQNKAHHDATLLADVS